MAKKLTAAELNKLSSKFNELKKVFILDGQYEVSIHTNFRESLIENVVMNYIEILEELKKSENVTNETVKNTVVLLDTLILREFTDLPIPKKNDIPNLIKFTHNLLDNGILVEVYNHIPKDQIEKVKTKLEQVSKGMGKATAELAIQAALQEAKAEDVVEVDTDEL